MSLDADDPYTEACHLDRRKHDFSTREEREVDGHQSQICRPRRTEILIEADVEVEVVADAIADNILSTKLVKLAAR